MIPKSGYRFSEKIMLQEKASAPNRERPMRLMIALLVIGLAASPSLAQKMLDSKQKKSEQSGPPKKSVEDKDYKAAVERLPDQKFDPWRNMR
jgi:hypothetical protein